MENSKTASTLTNDTNTFSVTETTGGIPAPPENDGAYSAYQDLINMSVESEEKTEEKTEH